MQYSTTVDVFHRGLHRRVIFTPSISMSNASEHRGGNIIRRSISGRFVSRRAIRHLSTQTSRTSPLSVLFACHRLEPLQVKQPPRYPLLPLHRVIMIYHSLLCFSVLKCPPAPPPSQPSRSLFPLDSSHNPYRKPPNNCRYADNRPLSLSP